MTVAVLSPAELPASTEPARYDRGWGPFAHAADVHCFTFHILVLVAYGVAFWMWLHPEIAGLTDLSRRTAFIIGCTILLGWISGIDIGTNYHNHVHRRIFKSAWMNRWFGRLWTFSGGWPAGLWKHAHVTVHHAHVLEDCDWTLPKKKADGRFENYWIYCLFHWPYRSTWHLANDCLTNRGGGRTRREFVKEVAIFAALWSIPFWIDPVMAVFLWVLPQSFGNFTMGSGMYVQHVGCTVPTDEHPYRHSNTFLSKFFNLTMFNIGYHNEHHCHAQIHWSDLPALHEAMSPAFADDQTRIVEMGYYRAADLISRGYDWTQDIDQTEAAIPSTNVG